MDSSQLVDSLTAHIALYNSSFAPSTSPPNPRASILRWFSSLTIHQRQSSLTVVDSKFTDILLEMLTKIQKQGGVAHVCFILLPDIPSRHNPSLPTLCFRRSKGLLARVSSSNTSHHSIRDAVRLFGSGDGENIDSITVSEEFVTDFDRLVSVMDGVTNGAFLRGEENLLASSWEELPWLKAKGYYSVEAFVANKLELALRLSWLNCNGGGKKRGAKLKEKANIAGVAANVYWRKKGCLDWWAALDPGTRKRIFQTVLAKAAKPLTKEILKLDNSFILGEECSSVMGEEQQLSYNCTSNFQSTNLSVSVAHANVEFHSSTIPSSHQPVFMSSAFNRLLVLQEVSAMILAFQHSEYKKDKLFFSTLASIHTVCDYILRRVRGLLMIVSSDCIKLDLLTGENVKSILNKSSDKVGGSRKGKAKGRNLRKLNSVPKPSGAKCAAKKPVEDQRCELVCKKTVDMTANGFNDTSLGKDPHKETSLSRVEVEHAKGVLDVKAQIGKNRKGTCSTKLSTTIKELSTAEDSKIRITKATRPVSFQCGVGKSNQSHSVSAVQNLPNDLPSGTDSLGENICSSNSINRHNPRNDSQLTKNTQVEFADGSTESSGNLRGCNMCSREEISECVLSSKITPPANPIVEADNVTAEEGLKHQNSEQSSDATLQPVCSPVFGVTDSDKEPAVFRPRYGNYDARGPTTCFGSTSYEWPSTTRFNVPFVYSHHLPAATDRLHLDVGRNWRNHFHQSFVSTRHQALNPPVESGHNRLLPQTLMMSLDWPPMVRSASRLTPSITCNYDSGFIPRLQPSFRQGFTHHGIQLNGMTSDEDRKYQSDALDSCDLTNAAEVTEDSETHWISEEEFEVHALSGRDYNQYFGGGVMYWNTSDHAGPGFSRPPSLSSEDNSWAWHEADLNRTIDDMVGFPSSYSSNGLTSPPAGSFCSSFDPLGPGHPSRGYVMPGNDVASKVLHSSSTQIDGVPEENVSGSMTNSSGGAVEGKKADSLPYPILRPIIIPSMSRKGSRSEFKLSHDHKSPRVPLIWREQPRIKRPPSPVVLYVPRAPCPLPPSPVGESRKRRGFPTVRSGSSSPRHWGLRSWYHDGTSSEEAGIHVDGAGVIWPSWRNEGISATPMIHPLPAALLHDRLLAISQLALDQEHPDVALPLQPPDILNCPAHKGSLSLLHRLLHDEIDSFCKLLPTAKNLIRKPYINWAVKRFARSLQVLWPRSRTNIFGSNATGLSLPTSDVDLVVCLPPVRNLEPIKEAGILEGRNGIKETCLQHAARYLANQELVKNDSLKTVENTAIPIIMLVAEVQDDLIISNANTSNMQQTEEVISTQMNSEDSRSDHFDMVIVGGSSWQKCQEAKTDKFVDIKSVCLDISFKSPSHSGLQTTELVRELTKQFPATTPLALVLKQFLADRSLDHSYSGGLSSYCLVLLITRFLQHEHHLGRPINQNLGSLLMDFLYFFGNVFDPRHMRISIQGSGYYVNRERGQSIDPIHIDDPLFPTNNVGRNCFRIHQCIKAFADAYSVLESELTHVPTDDDQSTRPPYRYRFDMLVPPYQCMFRSTFVPLLVFSSLLGNTGTEEWFYMPDLELK